MLQRSLALLVLACLALGAGGCESLFKSSNYKSYDEVLMPRQTGSTLQRRSHVPREPDSEKKKKPAKKKTAPPKPDAEPSATPTPAPTPEEESTPQPERFR